MKQEAHRGTRSSRETIIAVHADDCLHKIARLVASADGSFSISVPYHPARTGLIFKVGEPNLYNVDGGGWSPLLQRHTVSSLVKMSYHVGGFVQFSAADSRKVRSGRTGETDFLQPRGMGVHTQPLIDPILTGPSISVRMFAIHDCATVDGRERVPVMIFRPDELFYRGLPAPTAIHVYTVEVFVFPINARRDAVLENGRWILRDGYGSERPVWRTDYRIFDLPTRLAFLGIVVSLDHLEEPQRHAYQLAGPRDLGSRLWLNGLFPTLPDEGAGIGDELPTLDVDSEIV